MGVLAMEELENIVGAILKTLECPICLETLNIPVSAGCGHFFCKDCVTGILDSNYRAPCPLCKRSFTRRSVQEAHQRHAVIIAATTLAKTWSSLTGVKVLPSEKGTGNNRNESDVVSTAQPKAFKSVTKENQDTTSKKRKSWEIEDSTPAEELHSNMKDKLKETTDKESDDEFVSAKKRTCFDSDDSDGLPSFEHLLSQIVASPVRSNKSENNDVVEDEEEHISILPSDEALNIKSSTSYSKKHENHPKVAVSFSYDSSLTGEQENTLSKDASTDKVSSDARIVEPNGENFSISKKTKNKDTKLKNKVNALKNKTNKFESEQFIIEEDGFLQKGSDRKTKISKTEKEAKSKENNLFFSPSNTPHSSPVKNIKKKFRKCQTKVCEQRKNVRSSLSTEEEEEKTIKKIEEAMKHNLIVVRLSDENKCVNIEEVNISKPQEKNGTLTNKTIPDDPFKMTDTAVSVDPVTSPLTAKLVAMNKSPGWSRVKKVKKDFKMKQFSSLCIEKNSPNLLPKNTFTAVQPAPVEEESVVAEENAKLDMELEIVENECIANQNGGKFVEEIHDVDLSEGNKARDVKIANISSSINGRDDLVSEVQESEDKMEIDVERCPNNSKMPFLDAKESITVNTPAVSEVGYYCTVGENGDCISQPFKSMPQAKDVETEELHCSNNYGTHYSSGKFSIANNKDVSNISGDIDSYETGHKFVDFTDDYNLDDCNKRPEINSKYDNFTADDSSRQSAASFCGNVTPKVRKRKTFTMQAQISEYDESISNENRSLQLVEHSQQTSQALINFENPNTMFSNFSLIPQYPPQSFYNTPKAERTKVIKRTCLTLEEVQDSFLKSSQSGRSDIIYSTPFLSGQFKLHVCVSDETLNISVLKVLDSSETCNPQNTVYVFTEKCNQVPNNQFQVNSPTVLPSSNSSSQPDNNNNNPVPDPFPYLSKALNSQRTSRDIGAAQKIEINTFSQKHTGKDIINIASGQNLNDNLDTSEIVHFPQGQVKDYANSLERPLKTLEKEVFLQQNGFRDNYNAVGEDSGIASASVKERSPKVFLQSLEENTPKRMRTSLPQSTSVESEKCNDSVKESLLSLCEQSCTRDIVNLNQLNSDNEHQAAEKGTCFEETNNSEMIVDNDAGEKSSTRISPVLENTYVGKHNVGNMKSTKEIYNKQELPKKKSSPKMAIEPDEEMTFKEVSKEKSTFKDPKLIVDSGKEVGYQNVNKENCKKLSSPKMIVGNSTEEVKQQSAKKKLVEKNISSKLVTDLDSDEEVNPMQHAVEKRTSIVESCLKAIVDADFGEEAEEPFKQQSTTSRTSKEIDSSKMAIDTDSNKALLKQRSSSRRNSKEKDSPKNDIDSESEFPRKQNIKNRISKEISSPRNVVDCDFEVIMPKRPSIEKKNSKKENDSEQFVDSEEVLLKQKSARKEINGKGSFKVVEEFDSDEDISLKPINTEKLNYLESLDIVSKSAKDLHLVPQRTKNGSVSKENSEVVFDSNSYEESCPKMQNINENSSSAEKTTSPKSLKGIDSDSDKEMPLRLLKQCVNKEMTNKGKKKSRLSLRNKSRFRRTQICDSSDDSSAENCETSKNVPNVEESLAGSIADKSLRDILADSDDSKKSPKKKKEGMNSSLAAGSLLEKPLTLNSMMSEGGPEGDASEIALEIEDLADKIKFLEEKLKQCGHSDLAKSLSSSHRFSHETSKIHGSDSEDSNDLFPQSVPPTPPLKNWK